MYQKIHLGSNLLPEGLETGEYKIGGSVEINDLQPWYIVGIAGDGEDFDFGYKLNGMFNGIMFSAFSDVEALRGLLIQLILAGKNNKIMTIFTVPKLAFYPLEQFADSIKTDIKATPRPVTLNPTPPSLDGYIPKNQKLRTYPFCYLAFNPQNANSSIFRYENFENGIPQFDIISEINREPIVQFIPKNYRGSSGYNLEDICSMSGYPTISWETDHFNVWLAQNKNIIDNDLHYQQKQWLNNKQDNIANTFNGLGNTLGNLNENKKGNIESGFTSAIGEGGNTIYKGVTSFNRNNENWEYQQKSALLQYEQQKMIPNKPNFGSGSGTIMGYDLIDKSIFTKYTIKNQFARKIDKYFDMYGYQTNEVKLPNIKNRPNWNYIKTLGINITGSIPELDIIKIKSIFDNGLTLWHKSSTFLDYSQNNR